MDDNGHEYFQDVRYKIQQYAGQVAIGGRGEAKGYPLQHPSLFAHDALLLAACCRERCLFEQTSHASCTQHFSPLRFKSNWTTSWLHKIWRAPSTHTFSFFSSLLSSSVVHFYTTTFVQNRSARPFTLFIRSSLLS